MPITIGPLPTEMTGLVTNIAWFPETTEDGGSASGSLTVDGKTYYTPAGESQQILAVAMAARQMNLPVTLLIAAAGGFVIAISF
jgi:hypothetical protein